MEVDSCLDKIGKDSGIQYLRNLNEHLWCFWINRLQPVLNPVILVNSWPSPVWLWLGHLSLIILTKSVKGNWNLQFLFPDTLGCLCLFVFVFLGQKIGSNSNGFHSLLFLPLLSHYHIFILPVKTLCLHTITPIYS